MESKNGLIAIVGVVMAIIITSMALIPVIEDATEPETTTLDHTNTGGGH